MSDEVSGYPGAPPGWYGDPAGGPGQRWWDGYAWTETTVEPDAPPPPPPSPAPSSPGVGQPPYGSGPPPYGSGPPPYGIGQPPPPSAFPDLPHYGAGQPWVTRPGPGDPRALIGRELRLSPLARIAIAFPAIVTLCDVATAVANASQWRAFGHQYHLVIEATENNQTAPKLTLPSSLGGGLSGFVGFIGLALFILFLIWQHHAATTARALGWPSRRPPGWGVAFWFIPIVNLWMPYQAIRDCLSPGDPHRAAVLRFWLFFVGMGIGSSLTFFGLMISAPVGETFAVIAGICAVGVLATAPLVVVAITAAHRAAVTP